MNKAEQAAVSELKRTADPDELKDFLTEMQNQLISAGYCQGLTLEGSRDFAGNFQALQTFLSMLKKS